MVVRCPAGQVYDRGVCVNDCPLGTIPWRISARAQVTRCGSALELRDLITLLKGGMLARPKGLLTDGNHAIIRRARAALLKLPAKYAGCAAAGRFGPGIPGPCRAGARWNKVLERCDFRKCPKGKGMDRAECVVACPPHTIRWTFPSYATEICSTRIELHDLARAIERKIKLVPNKVIADKFRRNMNAVKAALVRRPASTGTEAAGRSHAIVYGLCKNSPEVGGPPPPEDSPRSGADDSSPNDGPPPPNVGPSPRD